MARFLLCLCLVLTLWMDGSGRLAAIRSGSAEAGFWWGTKESQQLGKQAARLRAAGAFAGAEALYERQLALARRSRDQIAIIRSLLSVGSTRVLEHRYRNSLAPLLEARRIAKSIGDRLDLGGIDVTLSSLYLQMWDLDSAVAVSEEGVAASARLDKPYYRDVALLQLGRLHQVLGDGQAEKLFQKGIEAAREQADPAQEAMGWDLLGEEWLRHQQFSDAERALDEAFRIRIFRDRAQVPLSYARLGGLKLAEGDLTSAGRLTGLAIAAGARPNFPEYLLLHQRGEIHLARGDIHRAIEDFRAASEQAEGWQRDVLPASSILTASNSELEKLIFDSFVETAAHQAVRNRDSRLIRESFQALEWNRAVSLRETIGLADVWRRKLPPDYWDTLAELRYSNPRADLNLKLTEMEAEAGLNGAENRSENFRTQTSLTHLQQGLSNSELLVSFHLGRRESYLWALTRRSLHIYALAPAAQIRREVQEFRNAAGDGRGAAEALGGDLYQQLFGQLSASESGKREWLLSLDDQLFAAPLAALKSQGRYLAEMHSLNVLPGALWLRGATGGAPAKGWFLGVSDPIYNAADPRWRGPRFGAWFAQAATGDGLNRLVASASEVESSARSWRGPEVILTGAEARRDKFVALAGRAPAVIHLATHALATEPRRGTAAIAFGLESSGHAGYLTTADVAMLNVPGAVVTMTGCATGGGEAVAGAGLLGLTRAWQIAGASAVVSTLWPVRDSSGDLFSGFYRRLRTLPPAEALRQSQVEMIQSGTWRAEPRYWANYRVTGGRLSK